MRFRNIQKDLQLKVRRFIEYMHNEEKNGSQKGEFLFNNLSIKLKNELNIDIFLKFIKKVKIFNDNFSLEFLENLSKHFKEQAFAPEEYIKRVFINIHNFIFIF